MIHEPPHSNNTIHHSTVKSPKLFDNKLLKKSNEFDNKAEKLSFPVNAKENAIHHMEMWGNHADQRIRTIYRLFFFSFNEIYICKHEQSTEHTAQSILFIQLFSAVNNKSKIKMN